MVLIYPGSFDPVTAGHISVARRAAKFAKIIIAVLDNPDKKTLFTVRERIAFLREVFETETPDDFIATKTKTPDDFFATKTKTPADFFESEVETETPNDFFATKTKTPADSFEIEAFGGLLADYATKKNADGILRGLRNAEDFTTENKYAACNSAISQTFGKRVETIFLPSTPELSHVSSKIVKEIAAYVYKNNLDDSFIAEIVPPQVRAALRNKFER
ncbi:MAG: adenylyltransferase/cytidyltransferase family protein [Defluviitaleaceae bacterium]|nr:adenylyltransferase/cytidyltransferase family protein [Defluviitaleaceae bacterium]